MMGMHAAMMPRLISNTRASAFGTPAQETSIVLTWPDNAVLPMQMPAVLRKRHQQCRDYLAEVDSHNTKSHEHAQSDFRSFAQLNIPKE